VIGDEADFVRRLRLTLPDHWFADAAPVLEGLMAGLSSSWAALHRLLNVVRQQSRLQTATDGFLDLASRDFFGQRLPRRAGEGDDTFRSRIQRAMHRERGTRAGLIAAAQDAGCTVQVFEPARPADTGAYNTPSALAWGVAGGWGSLSMPLECLVTVQRRPGSNDDELRSSIADSLPAGGVAWLRIVG
jgi:hypothetical protein